MNLGAEDEFVASARQALAGGNATEAMRALDWWPLLTDLHDPDARRAVFSLFRAQGRELADSPALAALMAAPYTAALGVPSHALLATATRRSARHGTVTLLVGEPDGRPIVIPGDDSAAYVVDATSLRRRPIGAPGRMTVAEVTVDLSNLTPALTAPDARSARATSLRLGRIAAAYEMLGAAEGAEAQALTHAAGREQFGQPIGAFQAVRHLLAWARTDLVAVEGTVSAAIDLDDRAPLRYDEMVKAIAGRNCRRACERTLQVLGAIGFTAEQGHHDFHGRVLLLDALLGSSADLTLELGAWLRELGTDPQVPLALLLPGQV